MENGRSPSYDTGTLRAAILTALALCTVCTSIGCGSSQPQAAQAPQPYPQQPYPYPQQQGYPPPGYPQQPYPQQPFPQQQAPQQLPQTVPQQLPPQQAPQQPAPQQPTFGLPFPFPFPIPGQQQGPQTGPTTATPTIPGFTPPLVGTEMQKQEVASILKELIAALPPDKQGRVRNIPLVFDPNPEEINAFAGCDDRGSPFMAGTVGILDAVDAIAQTKATDELFGTQTYEAYIRAVVPRLQQPKGGSAALPQGLIAPQHLVDPRRLARARDLFDEIMAFTFGHELAHHYMGHTGCANGQAATAGPNPAAIANLATRVIPLLNQPIETQADTEGTFNVLNTGKARRPRTRWTEAGGLILLDFFSRLDGISLLNPVGFLRTHPNPRGRIIWVQGVARTWAIQNPG